MVVECQSNLKFNFSFVLLYSGKGGKNRRRGKNENESEKRELVFKDDGQGKLNFFSYILDIYTVIPPPPSYSS